MARCGGRGLDRRQQQAGRQAGTGRASTCTRKPRLMRSSPASSSQGTRNTICRQVGEAPRGGQAEGVVNLMGGCVAQQPSQRDWLRRGRRQRRRSRLPPQLRPPPPSSPGARARTGCGRATAALGGAQTGAAERPPPPVQHSGTRPGLGPGCAPPPAPPAGPRGQCPPGRRHPPRAPPGRRFPGSSAGQSEARLWWEQAQVVMC
jgi:hypothetical protein